MTPPQDTPRAAFRLLPRRLTWAVVVVLVVVSLLAWRSTLDDVRSMEGMAMGLGQVGIRDPGYMSATVFLMMWTTMMAAMMLPTVAPMVLAHVAISRRRGDGVLPTLAFIGGYLLVWSGIGILPLLAYWGFGEWGADEARSSWLPLLAGAILATAGAYQFTGWKRRCLDGCQSPFGFVASHDFGGGSPAAMRAGAIHGAYCLGCCWALMAVLLVVGLMNLLWMTGIFLLFVIEKHWRHGLVMAKIVGALLVALGAMVAMRPGVLSLISQA